MDEIRIEIDDDTAAWLQAQAKAETGDAIGAVIERLVAERRALEDAVARDDHTWAKPAIDAGLASLDQGKGLPLADIVMRVKARATRRVGS